MDKIQGKIPLEAKFLISCKPLKPDYLYAYKIQWWIRHKIGIPIPQRKYWKEERSHRIPKSKT